VSNRTKINTGAGLTSNVYHRPSGEGRTGKLARKSSWRRGGGKKGKGVKHNSGRERGGKFIDKIGEWEKYIKSKYEE